MKIPTTYTWPSVADSTIYAITTTVTTVLLTLLRMRNIDYLWNAWYDPSSFEITLTIFMGKDDRYAEIVYTAKIYEFTYPEFERVINAEIEEMLK